MSKQIRFTNLVTALGKPYLATLWTKDPAADPAFKKAIDEHRIVTLQMQNVGNKKEKGEVGFSPGDSTNYLIFPKPLPMEDGTAVIGIKYDQLDEPPVKDPVEIKEAPRKPKAEKVKLETRKEKEESEPEPEPEPPKPKKKEEPPKYCVTVQFKAVFTKEIEVEAETAAAAMALAETEAADTKLEKPDWKIEALEVKKIK